MKRLIFAALLLFFTGPTYAQENFEEAHAWLQEIFPDDGPGITALVSEHGRIRYIQAHGMADIENGVAMSRDSVMRIGSLTKQFTAAGIILLQDAGVVNVNDPITDYYPDYPMHGYSITVHHLLTHTSGIKNYTSIADWFAENMDENLTTDELIAGFANAPMDFAPGTQYSYSNSGYVLLGGIIEKVTGLSYADYVQQTFFDPLDMTSTTYGGDQKIILDRAQGYVRSEDGVQNAAYIHMSIPGGAGALVSTVMDMHIWYRALSRNWVIDDYSSMVQVPELPDGAATSYAYGLVVGTLRGRTSHTHGGGINGFNTYSIWLPEEEIYVAVFANMNGRDPSPTYVAMKLAAITLGDPFPARVVTLISPDIATDYVGAYAATRGTTISVTELNGVVTANLGGERVLHSMAPDVFFVENSFWRFEFKRDDAGFVTSLEFYTSDESTSPLVLERQHEDE